MKDKLPSKFLFDLCQKKTEWQTGDFKVKSLDDAVQLYFIILNGHMEPDLRERAFYFGSLYRLTADLALVMGLGFVSTFVLFFANLKYVFLTAGYVGIQRLFSDVALLQIAAAIVLLMAFLFFRRPGNKGEKNLIANLGNQCTWLQTHETLIQKLLSGV